MATKQKAPPSRLSGAQLEELLALVKEADSVELKLSVPDQDHGSTLRSLDIDPLTAQIRQAFFFDTLDLDLNKIGLVVRARRTQGKVQDTVVKLRPVVPHELPRSLRKSPNFSVEVDAMPGGFVCSGSMKGTIETLDLRQVAGGKGSIQKLFTKEQRRLFADHAPEGVGMNDLAVLGPITVFKLKFKPRGFGRKLVAELWMYPDGSRILELSTKSLPADAVQAAIDARAFLVEKGVDLSARQQTKTKTALEFFAKSRRSESD